jgi:CelD/BcsL family acetyltransferase involved in cellulose biosynthesis
MPKVSICLPTELGPAEIDCWHKLQREDDRLANPFLAPEFALALGRHRPDVRVAVLTEGADVVGFFPHHRGPLGIGRGLGYGISNGQGLVHARGLEWDPGELLARCGLAVWRFDYLAGHQADSFGARHACFVPVPFIDLTRGWDEWLRARRAASNTVRKVLWRSRKLSRFGDVTFEFDSKSRDGLELLKKWKSRQYRRTGRSDPFSRPWFVAAFEELTQTVTDDFAGILSVLAVDGRPIAVHQGLCANGILSGWFPAYDVTMAEFSPGSVCALELVRAAAEQGLREIDMAKGQSDFKESLKNGEHEAAEGWAERPCAVAAVWRIQQAPLCRTREFVRARPRLRRVAKRALKGVGGVRTALVRHEGGPRRAAG